MSQLFPERDGENARPEVPDDFFASPEPKYPPIENSWYRIAWYTAWISVGLVVFRWLDSGNKAQERILLGNGAMAIVTVILNLIDRRAPNTRPIFLALGAFTLHFAMSFEVGAIGYPIFLVLFFQIWTRRPSVFPFVKADYFTAPAPKYPVIEISLPYLAWTAALISCSLLPFHFWHYGEMSGRVVKTGGVLWVLALFFTIHDRKKQDYTPAIVALLAVIVHACLWH